MTTELIFLAIALAVGLAPIVFARRTSSLGPGPKVAAVALGVAVFISAWILQESWTTTDSTPVNQPQQVSQDGYVSSDKCRACHPKEYDSWQQTYHRTMTQRATPQSVKGDFDNVELTDLKGVTYTLTRRDGEFWIAWQGTGADESDAERTCKKEEGVPSKRALAVGAGQPVSGGKHLNGRQHDQSVCRRTGQHRRCFVRDGRHTHLRL